ncbi:DUF1127 domain-containing protein [Alphaproteobacteria bacterium LSUCC0744]
MTQLDHSNETYRTSAIRAVKSALLLAAIGTKARRLCGACLRAYSMRIELARQRRHLAHMPEWQRRDIGIDRVAAKTEASRGSWVGGCRGRAKLQVSATAQKKMMVMAYQNGLS